MYVYIGLFSSLGLVYFVRISLIILLSPARIVALKVADGRIWCLEEKIELFFFSRVTCESSFSALHRSPARKHYSRAFPKRGALSPASYLLMARGDLAAAVDGRSQHLSVVAVSSSLLRFFLLFLSL